MTEEELTQAIEDAAQEIADEWIDALDKALAEGKDDEPEAGRFAMTLHESQADYSPTQPRDDQGRWVATGAGAIADLVMDQAPARSLMRAAEKKAVYGYTDGADQRINKTLRSGKIPPAAKDLDAAIERAGKLKAPVKVFRGIELAEAPSDLDGMLAHATTKFPVGGTVTDAGYQSTTTDYAAAQVFAGAITKRPGLIMEIKAKRGLYVDPLSAKTGENELLLPRGAKHKVLGHETFKDPETGRTMVVVRMEQL